MSIVTLGVIPVAEAALLQGFEEGISMVLGMIPVAGPFVQVIFGHIWELAFAERTAEQKQAAMNSLFESVGNTINKALAENVADQARAYNASIAQLGQDYQVSVQSFKDNNSAVAFQKVVVRFENCKSTLVHMLNLYAQSSYIKHTVLSYGLALAIYIGLLREMMLAGADCGYSKAEITDFHNDINDRIKSAYDQVMFDAVTKLVTETGEFGYPNMGGMVMDLGKLVGGLMNFQTEWHDGKACLIAPSHPDFPTHDLVDNKAYYQLTYRPKAGAQKNHYSMPQVFMNNRAAFHVFEDVDNELEVASFMVEETMNVKLRAYYLVDYNDYDSSDVEVTITDSLHVQVYQFHLNKRERAIVSFPWVKLYYSNTDGGPWTTHYDKFSTDMRMHYDEYAGFEPQEGKAYTIKTKAGSSSTTNYYIIGFEIVPASGVPNFLDSILNAIEKTASTVVSAGVDTVVTSSISAVGGALHL